MSNCGIDNTKYFPIIINLLIFFCILWVFPLYSNLVIHIFLESHPFLLRFICICMDLNKICFYYVSWIYFLSFLILTCNLGHFPFVFLFVRFPGCDFFLCPSPIYFLPCPALSGSQKVHLCGCHLSKPACMGWLVSMRGQRAGQAFPPHPAGSPQSPSPASSVLGWDGLLHQIQA